MTLQNKIKVDIMISTIALFSFIAFVGFIFIFAKSEGTLGDGLIVDFIADYVIYLFPFVLLYAHFQFFNFYLLLLITGLNILFYCFFLNKIISAKLADSKKYHPYKLTITVAYFIPSIIAAYVIYLIATSGK